MKKALIVDDSEANRLIIGAMVSDFGISIVYGEDGNEAIQKFAALRPEIVFIDQIMPEMYGSDAIKQMKLIAPEIPMVLMSALINPDELAEIVIACRADEFLPKPISFQVIQDVLRKYLLIP